MNYAGKDCDRKDCLIQMLGSSCTLLHWRHVYDRNGRELTRGDPNVRTTHYRCIACNEDWYKTE